jgi:ferredoxin-NADP reductase
MHRLKIIDIEPLTHNVRRYRLERPDGYAFVAGQATEMAIDQEGWREKKRPFTFCGLAGDPFLEFVIKSYTGHEGVTKKLGETKTGDHLLVDDPWETIPYEGPGTFIAGGAGITPFLALLRWLDHDGKFAGHRLIFSNTAERDIILRGELEAMNGLDLLLTVTGEKVPGLLNERIDRDFLARHVGDFSTRFYLCGPDEMTASIKTALVGLGAGEDRVFIAG